ncbi:MAG: carbohydrate porin [Hyphomicrobiales bacterium]|nr:carbohydrate porin [Hyphomicrobiales bacterium]
MSKRRAWGAALMALGATSAAADDVAMRAANEARPIRPVLWAGPYVGFHAGYGGGGLGDRSNPLPLQGVFLPSTVTGLIGGYQAGHNVRIGSRLMVGAEVDVSFPSPLDQRAFQTAPFNSTLEYMGTARARLGYVVGDLLPYATAGLAFGETRLAFHDANGIPFVSKAKVHLGWTAGVGLEHALTGKWTAKYEYNYLALGGRTYDLTPAAASSLPITPSLHLFKLGLNYQLWDTPTDGPAVVKAQRKSAAVEDDGWSIHGQTTFLPQAYPSFRSPYQGANSLPGKGQGRETWTTTAFVGRRLWDGGEIYFNPELAQGFGVGTTLGLGGFANGEAQKAGAPIPRFRAQRYFFRQTFGLGGEQEKVADGPNQLAGKRDIDRITLTVGRFAVGDFFDANSYAHDPRADFMNWAIWAAAAYDFPADLPGFTRGAVVELNRKNWALRGAVFQVPDAPNQDVLVFETGGVVAEWEGRFAIADRPGKVRLGAFYNRGNTGNYRDALAITAADPSIPINDAMLVTHRQRPKRGFYANLEQAISADVGVFARYSWNDGQNEILSFTDIDRSLSGGASIKGAVWGRPQDRIGVAAAVNGLSAPHRDFLAAGGLGLLIGDGRLNYRQEQILETFYAWAVNRWTTVTVDYQFITNPAYNADRGPVSLFAVRVHAEF